MSALKSVKYAALAALVGLAVWTPEPVAAQGAGRSSTSVTTNRGGGGGGRSAGEVSRGSSRANVTLRSQGAGRGGSVESGRGADRPTFGSDFGSGGDRGRGDDFGRGGDRERGDHDRDRDWDRDHDRRGDRHWDRDHDRHDRDWRHRGHPRSYRSDYWRYRDRDRHRSSLSFYFGSSGRRYYDHDHYHFPSHHVHGPHCGHYYFHDRWHLYPESYYVVYEDYGPYYPYGYPGYSSYSDVYVYESYGAGYPGTYGSTYGESYAAGVAEGAPLPSHYGAEQFQAGNGYRLFEQQDYYGAIAAFNAALLDDPENSGLYLMRGLAYVGIGETHGAARDFEQWVELTPLSARRGLEAAPWYGNVNEFNTHVAEVQSRARAYSQSAEHQFVSGLMLFLAGREAEARTALERATALNPGHQAARALLAQLAE